MNIFSKPEHKLNSAVADVEKFITKFNEAADAASKEIAEIDINLSNATDLCDSTIEKAYSKYMRVEEAQTEKYNAFKQKVEEREVLLVGVIKKATSMAEAFKANFGL
jgi:G3E family GTPase